MTDSVFIQEIVSRPDDDLPRLIYADWLEEQGDPRSDFIRVQCQLAQLKPWDADYWPLKLRSDALIADYGREWKAPLSRHVKSHFVEFHRGFPEVIAATARDFLEVYPHLLDHTPVTRLKLLNSDLDILYNREELASLREITFTNLNTEQVSLSRFLAADTLHDLRGLHFENSILTEEFTTALEHAQRFKLLEKLTFFRTDLSAATDAHLWLDCLPLKELSFHFDSGTNLLPWSSREYRKVDLTALEQLHVRGGSPVDFNDVFWNPTLKQLKSVTTYGSSFSWEQSRVHCFRIIASAIVQVVSQDFLPTSDRLSEFQSLEITGGNPQDQDLEFLTFGKEPFLLQNLKLHTLGFSGKAVDALYDASHLSSLKVLDVNSFCSKLVGHRLAKRVEWLTGLQYLSLRGCPIRQAGVKAILDAPQFESLLFLDVRDVMSGMGKTLPSDLCQALRERFGNRVWY